MSASRVAGRQHDICLECGLRIRSAQHDPCCVCAEPHHLRVVSRPRREPLRPDVETLEKVCLPRAVRTMNEHDTRLELELQAGVRTKVPERDLADDQPASRIGMIRYQKLSSGDTMSPGRRRLMSLS